MAVKFVRIIYYTFEPD